MIGDGWHAGLYYAGFSTLDDDGQAHRPVHQPHSAWDGTAELSLAG